MTHISMILGENPDVVGERVNHGAREALVVTQSWKEHLGALGEQPFRRPPDSVVFEDGSEVTLRKVGKDGMRAVVGAIDPSKQVTVVQANR